MDHIAIRLSSGVTIATEPLRSDCNAALERFVQLTHTKPPPPSELILAGLRAIRQRHRAGWSRARMVFIRAELSAKKDLRTAFRIGGDATAKGTLDNPGNTAI
ncbi:MAG: hypothetical protein ABI830_15350 [Pseudolabrys sp.]